MPALHHEGFEWIQVDLGLRPSRLTVPGQFRVFGDVWAEAVRCVMKGDLQAQVTRVGYLPCQHLPHGDGEGKDVAGLAGAPISQDLRSQPSWVGGAADSV